MRIGLDLDNTLIDYDAAYSAIAEELSLPPDCRDRDSVRALLRQAPPEDHEWQAFQSRLYTEGLLFSAPASGSLAFLEECQRREYHVYIISHKTETTQPRFGGRNLRLPAIDWLRGVGICPEFVNETNVIWCSSVEDKIMRINQENLDLFIDDLMNILESPLLSESIRTWHLCTKSENDGILDRLTGRGGFEELTLWMSSH